MFRKPPTPSERDQASRKKKDSTDGESSKSRVKKLLAETQNISDEEDSKPRGKKLVVKAHHISESKDKMSRVQRLPVEIKKKKTNSDEEDSEPIVEKTEEENENIQEKLEMRKKKLFSLLKVKVESLSTMDKSIDQDCNYNKNVNDVLNFIHHTNAFDGASLEFVDQYRADVAKYIMDTEALALCCNLFIHSYPRHIKSSSMSMYCTEIILQDFSDISVEFAQAVANFPGYLEAMKKMLTDVSKQPLDQDLCADLVDKIGILHNIGMSDNVSRLQELDFTALLKVFLTTSNDTLSLVTLSVLASIVNEKEAEIINANKDVIRLLLRVLQTGLGKKQRRFDGWSCKECATILRKLATNDANKKLLVELGALQLLIRLAKTGSSAEKIESTGAIWALCFDSENRAKIVCDKELMDLLEALSQSGDKQVKKNCRGALWTLRVEPARDKPKTSTSTGGKKPHGGQGRDESSSSGHIMISYQWADQATLIKIRDHLKAHNLKVWIDIDQMGGSTLEAMAASIEQAKVVLICMSQKYKNSPNCRAEAEYAFQRNKTIVPLKMERGFTPDGWLGIILGTKLFFEFSSKYPFDDKMKQLLREVSKIYSDASENTRIVPERVQPLTAVNSVQDDVDSPMKGPVPQSPVSMAATFELSRETAAKVRHWGSEEVKTWLTENRLSSSYLDNITGEELALLLCLRYEAPEFFYKTLRRRLHLKDLVTMSRFVWALTDLATKS